MNVEIPKGRASASLISVATGTFILYGGGSREEAFNDFWCCQVNSSTLEYEWSRLNLENDEEGIISARYGAAIFWDGQYIYVHGGQNMNQEMFADLIKIEVNLELKSAKVIENLTKYPFDIVKIPTERNSHLFAQSSKDQFFIYGGGHKEGLHKDCFVLNPKEDNWKKLKLTELSKDMEIEMGGLSIYNNSLYVICGRQISDISNSIFKFDLGIETTIGKDELISGKIIKLPFKLCSFAYTTFNEWFIIYGGLSETFLQAFYLFNMANEKWYSNVKSSSYSFSSSICASISNDGAVVLLFGGSSLQLESNQTTVVLLSELISSVNLVEIKQIK